jgi:nitrogen fixation-related uncharacterized protein
MFPSSLAVVLTGLALGVLALAVFVWGWRRGHFSNLDAQARVPLDPHDYRCVRAWETPRQRAEREREYGAPVEPAPGEWGGAE